MVLSTANSFLGSFFAVAGGVPVLHEVQKLVPADLAEGDRFGADVAMEGALALVGAPYADTPAVDAGAVYAFRHLGGRWVQTQKLVAGDASAGSGFGWSVAISGDFAAVGAWQDDAAGDGAGAVYLFSRSGGTWIERDKITASDARPGAWFGYDVAVDGKLVVVGSPYHDGACPGDPNCRSGKAYVFRSQDGVSWHEWARLSPPELERGDQLGFKVDVDEDVFAGAIGDDDLAQEAGAVYVYERTGSTPGPVIPWTLAAKLIGETATVNANLGSGLSVLDGRLLVGAQSESTVGMFAGAAYFFLESPLGWDEEQKVLPGDPFHEQAFGRELSLSAGTAVIGAPLSPRYGFRAGEAYVIASVAGSWTEVGRLAPSDVAGGDNFSFGIAHSGNRCLGGSWNHSAAAPLAGAVYAFELDELLP